MAYDIGPRIGIQGEKEFNDQIKKINNSLRECGSEMKALSAEFEDNANSQDALIAKQKNLTKEYGLQQEKIKLLRDQYEKQTSKLKDLASELETARREFGETSTQASKAEAAFNRQAETVSKLSVAINETQSFLNRLNNEGRQNHKILEQISSGLRDASTGMSKFSESAGEADRNLDKIARNTSISALGEIGDAAAEAGEKIIDFSNKTIESFSSLESAVSRVNTYFGLTGEDAERMGSVVENVFKTGVTDSLDRVGEAVIYVNNNLRGLDSSQLESITAQAITLEDVFGSDMSETMRGVNALMGNFQISAEEAMDYIVKATQNGLDKTQELGDNISEYSGKFSQAGYSARDYFTVLQNGIEGGAYNLNRVNDAINEVTNKMVDGSIADAIGDFSEKTQEAFEAWQNGEISQKYVIDSIISDIQNATTQQEALNLASAAFGSLGEDSSLEVIKALQAVGLEYNRVVGSAEQMMEISTTPMQQIQASLNEIQLQLAPLGEKLLSFAVQILPPIVDGITMLIDNFMNLSPSAQSAILTLAGFAAALTAIIPIITSIASVISLLSGPVIAAVAVIAALVTAFQHLWRTNEEFRDNVGKIWEEVKNIIATVIDGISEVFSAFIELVELIWQKWGDDITSITMIFLEYLQNLFSSAFQILGEIINFFLALFQGDFSGCFEAIKNIIITVLNVILSLTKTWFLVIIELIKSVNPELGAAMETAFQAAIDFITSLPGKAVQWGKDFMQGLIDGINSMIDAVKNAVSNVADAIASFLHFSRPDEGPLREYEKWMPDFISGMAQGIYQNISKIQDAAAAVSGTIDSAITGQVVGMADSASYSREMMIAVDGDTIVLDGKAIGKTATKYITTGQVAGAAAQGRRLRNVQHNVQR